MMDRRVFIGSLFLGILVVPHISDARAAGKVHRIGRS
jgi:hypothetical protein